MRSLSPDDAHHVSERFCSSQVPIDLNGIKPTDLLIGAFSYAVVCVLAWQVRSFALSRQRSVF